MSKPGFNRQQIIKKIRKKCRKCVDFCAVAAIWFLCCLL